MAQLQCIVVTPEATVLEELVDFVALPLYDGSYTAGNGDVIVVNINYRVGALGFLSGVKDAKTGEALP